MTYPRLTEEQRRRLDASTRAMVAGIRARPVSRDDPYELAAKLCAGEEDKWIFAWGDEAAKALAEGYRIVITVPSTADGPGQVIDAATGQTLFTFGGGEDDIPDGDWNEAVQGFAAYYCDRAWDAYEARTGEKLCDENRITDAAVDAHPDLVPDVEVTDEDGNVIGIITAPGADLPGHDG